MGQNLFVATILMKSLCVVAVYSLYVDASVVLVRY